MTIGVTIGGNTIDAIGFQHTGGSYGSIARCRIETTFALLASRMINLYALTSVLGPTDVYVSAATTSKGAPPPFFGGEVTDIGWNLDEGTVTINAQSWAGRLADQRRVPTQIIAGVAGILQPLAIGQNPSASGISTQNQKIAALVTQIATLYGLTPIINLPEAPAGPAFHGIQYASQDVTWSPSPQSMWKVLNDLARDTGAVVYDLPDKSLYFGVPGAGKAPLRLCYGYATVPSGQQPIRRVVIQHQLRRNATFRVLVTGYDPGRAVPTKGQATAIGQNMAGIGGLAAGIYSGPQAVAADKALAKLKKGASAAQIPLYQVQLDGFGASQAQAKAAAIAADIASRELQVSFEAEFIAGMAPTIPAVISYAQSAGLPNSGQFYVSAYSHSFVMPRRGGGGGGLMTRATLLNVPVEALASDPYG